MIIVDLIFNLALLVAVSTLSGFIGKRWKRESKEGQVLQGLLFGIVALIGMLNPFVLTPGIIFDGRSVVLSLCGLFFGPVSAFIAAFIALVYRIYVGGGGAVMGVSVIISSALVGVLFHRDSRTNRMLGNTYYLYGIGLLVHIIMLVLMLTIPSPMRITAFRTLSMTIIGIYPIATALIGKILKDQVDSALKAETEEALKESENRFASFMENLPALAFIKDQEFRLIYTNKAMNDALGSQAWIGKTPQECFPGDKGEQILNDDRQTMKKGFHSIVEDFTELSGRVGTFETHKFIIPNQDKGDMLGGIAMNITERKVAEEALSKKARDLENFNSLMLGRELRMIDLKKEINGLLAEMGKESRYFIHETPEGEFSDS